MRIRPCCNSGMHGFFAVSIFAIRDAQQCVNFRAAYFSIWQGLRGVHGDILVARLELI